MDDLTLWALAYLGVGVLAGLLRLLLLKQTSWRESAVTWICRLGPSSLFLAYLLLTAALDSHDGLAWGLTLLLGPTFILPLVAVCYAGVWASELVLPRKTIRKVP
jgi:hypothetical protein